MRLIVAIVLVVVLSGHIPDAKADFEAAEQAYKNGNYQVALSALQPLADRGDARAQSLLGLMHARGHGTAIDHEKAVPLFRKSAEQGDPVGFYGLGIAHLNGYVVSRDLQEAARWLRMGAEKDHPQAAFHLGRILLRNPSRQDVTEGMARLNQARHLGLKDAEELQRAFLARIPASSARFSGGFGDSVETAVVIEGPQNTLDGIRAENTFIAYIYPGWTKYGQDLLSSNGKIFDLIEIRDEKGATRSVFFDITAWFGKM